MANRDSLIGFRAAQDGLECSEFAAVDLGAWNFEEFALGYAAGIDSESFQEIHESG